MRIFLCGPGGVGKSTAAAILAPMLGYHLVDLDSQFMSRIGHIGEVIKTRGYQEYVRLNSHLFFQLINEVKESSLFVLSSGFLASNHDPELVHLHRTTVADLGRTVVLLPSESYEVSERVVLERQLARGFGLIRERETEKFRKRYFEYLKLGLPVVFALGSPKDVADELAKSLHLQNG